MSASDKDSSIFVDDSKGEIKRKISKKAFSGGKDTKEEQEKYGADIEVDVSVQFLRFFWEDDEGLAELEQGYKSGALLTGHVKAKCTEVLTQFIREYQERRKKVTDEQVKEFTSVRPMKPFADLKKPIVKKEEEIGEKVAEGEKSEKSEETK